MDPKNLAIAVTILATAGLPVVLIVFTVGGLFAGFALWSILNFLSQWMVLLIFLGAGVVALIELAPRGPLMAVLGVAALLFAVFFGYVLWTGALNGPTNTYELFYSISPLQTTGSNSSVTGQAAGSDALLAIAIILAIALVYYAIKKLERNY